MDTKQMEYIIAISKEKNLTKAASKLYLSQSALSQQVAKAEKSVNARLFERDHSEMVLTDAGRIYLSGASTILQIKKQALAELEDLTEDRVRHLTIGLIPQIKQLYYTNILPDMKLNFPYTELEVRTLETAQAKEQLLDGSVSMAVYTTASVEHALLEYIPLYKDEMMMILPPDSPENQYTPEEFLEFYPFALPPDSSHLRTACNRILAKSRRSPEIYSLIDDLSAILYLTEHGHCAAFVPKSAIPANSNVKRLSLTSPYHFYMVAAYKNDSILRAPVKYLIKQFLTNCTNHESR